MHFSLPVLAVLCSSIATTLVGAIPSTNQLLHRGAGLKSRIHSGLDKRDGPASCTPENSLVRKEWRTLSNNERKRYTDAVLCLRNQPTLYPEVVGAKSRFDDFQIVHINQTGVIHFNAVFLAWHRWFIWRYDQAMRQECGYTGFQPYWDWTLDASDIQASPLFDGSPYSMSGNGQYIANRSDDVTIIDLPEPGYVRVPVPPGTGGGCVTTGPFANITVAFGELGGYINASSLNNPQNLAYKPHCLRRDLNPNLIAPALTAARVEDLLQRPNISDFTHTIELGDNPNITNVHGAGHLGVGRDMRDTFSANGDPIFYLHHAQLDRIWTMWQNRNLTDRQYGISGTGTMFNYPPSPEFQLNDTITLEKLGGTYPIRDFLNTRDGPFCYEYA